MVADLPPTKSPDQYTVEEKRQIVKAAQAAAEDLVNYIRRLAEIDAAEGGQHGHPSPDGGHPGSSG